MVTNKCKCCGNDTSDDVYMLVYYFYDERLCRRCYLWVQLVTGWGWWRRL